MARKALSNRKAPTAAYREGGGGVGGWSWGWGWGPRQGMRLNAARRACAAVLPRPAALELACMHMPLLYQAEAGAGVLGQYSQ